MPIEALYTVVPLIIVSVLFYFTARDETKLLSLDKKPDVTVNVVGFQWSWGFNYIENVDGASGDATTDKNLAAIPDRFKKEFPANAGWRLRRRHARHEEPADGQPGSDPLAPQGRDGPLRPHLT